MPTSNLNPSNTLAIAAASGVYRLNVAAGRSGLANVLNLGPGTVYVRSDGTDPTVADVASLALPANMGFNGLSVGSAGLRVIAGADSTITVQVA